MIGRWPTLLLLLLSVCNTIYTHIFFLSKVLSFAFVCSSYFFFSLSLVEFSHLIICPFDKLFLQPLSTAKASDDARRKLDHLQAFLPEVSVISVPPRSRSLSRKREKENTTTFFRALYSFCETKGKSPLESNRESFSTNTGCFCTKKKRRERRFSLQIIVSSLNARKFSRA